MNPEPWYGVRLVYRLVGQKPAFEERVLIVRADDTDSAIERAEQLSRENYESETTVYTDYAMAFNIFDENSESLGEGVEVFSLIRHSDLGMDAYLDRFHDTGAECSQTQR
ncbi:MAG: hypothetical protein Aurels2KO_13300 [Aureliella sp.]